MLLARWLTGPAAPTATIPLAPTAHRYQPPAAPPNTGQVVWAEQGGRVWEVYFQDGQRVRQGQLLIKVAQKQPSPAQRQLTARLHQQQAALDTLLATRPTPDSLALAAARQRLRATRAQLARAVPQLSFGFVTAPADGVVRGRAVAPGDYLPAHTAVAQLTSEPVSDTTLLFSSVE